MKIDYKRKGYTLFIETEVIENQRNKYNCYKLENYSKNVMNLHQKNLIILKEFVLNIIKNITRNFKNNNLNKSISLKNDKIYVNYIVEDFNFENIYCTAILKLSINNIEMINEDIKKLLN